MNLALQEATLLFTDTKQRARAKAITRRNLIVIFILIYDNNL